MKLSTSLSALLISINFGYASSLAVYQDSTFYSFSPKNSFIGFAQGIEAKCEGTASSLIRMTNCPSEERLCRLLTGLKDSEQKAQAVQENRKVLDQLTTLPRPAVIDTDLSIESAKRIGEEHARLISQEKLLAEEILIKESEFQKQAPSKQALQLTQMCSKDIVLTIPYGYVTFSTEYEANIANDKEVTVTQYLSITNRSGMDIEAKTAMFYYRSADQYVDPVHFRPLTVRKYEPVPREASPRPVAKIASMNMAMADEQRVSAAAPIVSYEDAREYKIENLVLPSTGVPLDVKVISWKAPLSCDVRAYPYERTQVFHVCSFEPKYQIDSNQWKVKSSQEVINENAAGEYREGKYTLYTKVEDDIKIERKQIVDKERQTGIFGGTVRKQDGFTLTVTNKSDKEKVITVIERIPTSTTEDIKSKLLSIKSEKKVKYKLLEDGKIEMKLTLEPHENKQIEVLFEISHDKDLKINY